MIFLVQAPRKHRARPRKTGVLQNVPPSLSIFFYFTLYLSIFFTSKFMLNSILGPIFWQRTSHRWDQSPLWKPLFCLLLSHDYWRKKMKGFSNLYSSQNCFDVCPRKTGIPLSSLICFYHAHVEELPHHCDPHSCRSTVDWLLQLFMTDKQWRAVRFMAGGLGGWSRAAFWPFDWQQ